jgi:PAS domain S-box-containing protein
MAASRILIVQDKKVVSEDIAERLRGSGYEVVAVVASGQEAIKKAEDTSPDMLLIDIVLQGGMDGIEAASQIRSRCDIPIVFLTAHAEKDLFERAKITEPFGYLTRPVSPQDLLSTVEMAFYKHKMEKRLKESEEKYRTLFEESRDAVYITTRDGQALDVNQSFLDLFGYSREEIMGAGIKHIYVDANDRKSFQEEIERTGSVKDYETRFRRRDGIELNCLETASVRRGEYGTIVGYQGIIRDITERKQAVEALRQSEERLRLKLDYILSPEKEVQGITLLDLIDLKHLQQIQDSFAKATGVASIISDADGNPITKPSNFCGVCRAVRATEKGNRRCIESDRILGEKARKLLRPTYQECLSCGFVDASAPIIVAGQHIANWLIGQTNVMGVDRIRIEEYAAEICADPNEMLTAYDSMLDMSLHRFKDILDLLWHFAREISILGYNNLKLAKELTHRRQAEEHVRSLTQALIRAQEWERERISRDLHDNLAQDLSSLRISYEMFLDDLGQLSSHMKHRGSQLSKMIHQSITAVRDLSHGLRPRGLDQMGLVRTISRYCKDFSSKTGLQVNFHAMRINEPRLDADTAINLFRVVQEALRNVRKHAQAKQVNVVLETAFPNMALRIEDDGKGFDVDARSVIALSEKRMGLWSMKERVNLLSGEMKIQSSPMKGTRILVEVPWKEKGSDLRQERLDRR